VLLDFGRDRMVPDLDAFLLMDNLAIAAHTRDFEPAKLVGGRGIERELLTRRDAERVGVTGQQLKLAV